MASAFPMRRAARFPFRGAGALSATGAAVRAGGRQPVGLRSRVPARYAQGQGRPGMRGPATDPTRERERRVRADTHVSVPPRRAFVPALVRRAAAPSPLARRARCRGPGRGGPCAPSRERGWRLEQRGCPRTVAGDKVPDETVSCGWLRFRRGPAARPAQPPWPHVVGTGKGKEARAMRRRGAPAVVAAAALSDPIPAPTLFAAVPSRDGWSGYPILGPARSGRRRATRTSYP